MRKRLIGLLVHWRAHGDGIHRPRRPSPALNGKIAFDYHRDVSDDIYVDRARRLRAGPPITGRRTARRGPAWSPDGTKIACWT